MSVQSMASVYRHQKSRISIQRIMINSAKQHALYIKVVGTVIYTIGLSGEHLESQKQFLIDLQ
jgi:hypothetical protein